jgi:hypothetical protein
MTVTQTVDIPESHRLVIDVPREVPAGRSIISFNTVPAGKTPVKSSDERDIEIINRNAERLNREAMDVLSYQNMFLDDLDL